MSGPARREPLYGRAGTPAPVPAGPRREPLHVEPVAGRPELAEHGPAHREPLHVDGPASGRQDRPAHREPLHASELADLDHAGRAAHREALHAPADPGPADLAGHIRRDLADAWHAETTRATITGAGRPQRLAGLLADPSGPDRPQLPPAAAQLLARVTGHPAGHASHARTATELADDARAALQAGQHRPSGPSTPATGHAYTVPPELAHLVTAGRPDPIGDAVRAHLAGQRGRLVAELAGDVAHAGTRARLEPDGPDRPELARAAALDERTAAILAEHGPTRAAGRPVHALQLADGRAFVLHVDTTGAGHWTPTGPAPLIGAEHLDEDGPELAQQPTRRPAWPAGPLQPDPDRIRAQQAGQEAQELADDAAARARACTCLHRAPDGPPCPIGGRPDAFHAAQWQCAACGARTRARMADHAPHEAPQDERPAWVAAVAATLGVDPGPALAALPQDVETAHAGPDTPGTGPAAGTPQRGRPATPQDGPRRQPRPYRPHETGPRPVEPAPLPVTDAARRPCRSTACPWSTACTGTRGRPPTCARPGHDVDDIPPCTHARPVTGLCPVACPGSVGTRPERSDAPQDGPDARPCTCLPPFPGRLHWHGCPAAWPAPQDVDAPQDGPPAARVAGLPVTADPAMPRDSFRLVSFADIALPWPQHEPQHSEPLHAGRDEAHEAPQDGPDLDELAARVRDAGTWERNPVVRRVEPATLLHREPLHAFTDAAARDLADLARAATIRPDLHDIPPETVARARAYLRRTRPERPWPDHWPPDPAQDTAREAARRRAHMRALHARARARRDRRPLED